MLQDIRYTIYNMVLHFKIFQGCFEALKLQYFKLSYMSPLLPVCITTYQLLAVELVTYCKTFLCNLEE